MRVVLATIIGFIAGNGVNMLIGEWLLPIRVEEGGDQLAATLEAMESFTTMDYFIPLSAHVFGVLVGLIVARLICKTSNIPIYIIGGLHILGTLIMQYLIPAPGWFIVADLVIPILIIAYFLRTKRKK